MLKKLGLALLALVVLFLAVGFILPSQWHVERSVTIAAPPETITPFIADTRNWEKWAAWNNKMDPDAKWTFFVVPDTKLAAMSWSGPKLGVGLLKIVEVTPAKSVRYHMEMEGRLSADGQSMSGGSPANGGFTYSVDAGKTTVTWTDEGDMGMNLPGRYFIGTIEKMLGEHFAIGLDGLKKVAEEAQAAAAAAAPPAEAPAAKAEAR